MNSKDCMNGVEHSIAEIDQALIEAIPATRRNMYRGEAWKAIDELLDQRNLLVEMLGELTIDHYEEMMQGGDM